MAGKAVGGLAVAGDVFTLADPSPHALGGPTTERIAAAGNLGAMAVTAGPVAGLLAANVATDWIPVACEVVMAATAAYFVGDLIYQNRQEIGHALSWTGHEAVHVASDVGHGLAAAPPHALALYLRIGDRAGADKLDHRPPRDGRARPAPAPPTRRWRASTRTRTPPSARPNLPSGCVPCPRMPAPPC